MSAGDHLDVEDIFTDSVDLDKVTTKNPVIDTEGVKVSEKFDDYNYDEDANHKEHIELAKKSMKSVDDLDTEDLDIAKMIEKKADNINKGYEELSACMRGA